MRVSVPSMLRSATLVAIAVGSLAILAGCATVAPAPATEGPDHSMAISDEPPLHAPLPSLATDSPPDVYVRFALLNHPAVAAAWSDWRAAQASIMPARALPDPQITFQADIASTIMSLMPGVMFDLMAPGKRAAMGREAEAGARVARSQYASALVRVAAEARKAFLELNYLDAAIALREASVAAAEQTGTLAASEYSAGRGMAASLDAQLKSADEAARLRSEVAGLEDRRSAARARLKSALGLVPTDPDPAWPHHQLSVTALPPPDELWRRLQESNPDLATMRAMVEMAVAGVDVAQRRGTPDFTLGLMTDVKQAPWMWRPTATVTLPIWRDKIRETIAAAQARKDAAAARVDAEQLTMAAELAQMLAMTREADRMIGYIDTSALPSLARARATATSGYRTGTSGAAMIAATGGMEIAMRTERLAALRERELAVVGLLAMTANVAPTSP